LYSWLVVGNLAGEVIAAHYPGGYPADDDREICLPRVTIFGVIDTRCQSELAGWAWSFGVEIPRLIIAPVFLSMSLLRASIHNGLALRYALEALPWAAYSMVFLLIAVPGFRYWRNKSPYLAWGMTLPLFLVILDAAASN